MYTTYKGLQYDCVFETNPLFGERPSVMTMGVRKIVILAPAIVSEQNNQTLSIEDMRDINLLMGLVVLNNASISNKSSKRCNKLQKPLEISKSVPIYAIYTIVIAFGDYIT